MLDAFGHVNLKHKQTFMTVFYPLSLSLVGRRTAQQPPSVIIYINVRVKDYGVKRISTGFTIPEKQ